MAIKYIIFDLGGVIIDINYTKTLEAFRLLGGYNIEMVYTQSKQDTLFDSFETGKISNEEFRKRLQAKLDILVSDEDFDKAWNAMLLDLPLKRLDFIKSLRSSYKVFLFSNTNDIHLKEVFNICKAQNGFSSFASYFDKEYYSHTFGMRKPNKEAFTKILEENNMEPSETLFIDDSVQHIMGAIEAGIHTLHLTPEKSIYDIIDYISRLNNQSTPSEEKTRTLLAM